MTTININLLPEDMRSTKSGGSSGGGSQMPDSATMMPILIGLGVAIAIGLLPTAITMLYLDPKQAEVQEAEDLVTAEINKYNTTLNQLKGIADNKEFLRQQLATLQSVAGMTTSWGDILNEMRSLTPANLWFDTMKTDNAKGEFLISGGALDYGSVAYFHRNLENSDFFYEPLLTKTDMTTAATGVTVVKFDLTVKVRTQKKT